MKIPLEAKIALRYMKPKRKKGLISFVAFVSITGIALGVGALIIVISVMSGFDEHIKKGIIDSSPHIYVMSYTGKIPESKVLLLERRIKTIKGIKHTAPFVHTQALIKTPSGTSGIYIRGVDPEREKEITNLSKRIILGSWSCLNDENTIIVGKALAKQLGIIIGSSVTIITTGMNVTPFGFFPKSKRLRVCAIFETGMYNIDSNIGIVSLKTAQKLTQQGMISGIEVSVKDIYKAREIAKEIQARLKYPYWCNDWISMNKPLFGALKLEKLTMFLILTLIVIVASFSIISTLSMTVMDKAKDIAILCAMGMTRKRITKIFLFEGVIMGIIGIFIGAVLGLGGCFLLERYKIIKLPSDIYYINYLPVKISLLDITIIFIASFIITLLSTYFPARQAGKLSPVEILRYE